METHSPVILDTESNEIPKDRGLWNVLLAVEIPGARIYVSLMTTFNHRPIDRAARFDSSSERTYSTS